MALASTTSSTGASQRSLLSAAIAAKAKKQVTTPVPVTNTTPAKDGTIVVNGKKLYPAIQAQATPGASISQATPGVRIETTPGKDIAPYTVPDIKPITTPVVKATTSPATSLRGSGAMPVGATVGTVKPITTTTTTNKSVVSTPPKTTITTDGLVNPVTTSPVINNSVATPTDTFKTFSTPNGYVEKDWMKDGKPDMASLFEDMKSNLSKDQLKSFNDSLKAAGSDVNKQNAVISSIKSAVNGAIKKNTPPASITENISKIPNLTDAEKIAQAKQSTYATASSNFDENQKNAFNDIKSLNSKYRSEVLNTMGLNEDGTPDLNNTNGQYYKSKQLYDNLVTNNRDAFNTIRQQIEADLGGAGKQIAIQAGLSGDIDPVAIGLKMGSVGQKAIGLVNDANNAMLKQEGAILEAKNNQLAKLVSDGIISAEAYDKATALAKANYDQNVYSNRLNLMEAAFGTQESANAYDEANRTNRINTISTSLSAMGLTPSEAFPFLSSFNFRRDENGNLETPERALLRLSEWTKSDIKSINPQFYPKNEQELTAWKEFQKTLKSADDRAKAAAIFQNQIELMKAEKSGTSGGEPKVSGTIANNLASLLSSASGVSIPASFAQNNYPAIMSLLNKVNSSTDKKDVDLGSGIIIPKSQVKDIIKTINSSMAQNMAQ